MRMPQSLVIAGASVAASIAVSSPAAAHAYLKAANPAADATVTAPKKIVLQMSEKVLPKFSGLAVSAQSASVPVNVKIVNDQIIGIPRKPLKPGIYVVEWHAVGPDTHRMTGKFTFTVR